MVALAVAPASCGGSTGGSTGGTGAAGGGGPLTGGGGAGASGGGGTTTAVVCNGVPCAPHEQCCLVPGKCFDPATNPGACEKPGGTGPQGQKACAASSQCAPDEYCTPANPELCLGPGYCASTTNCPSSSPGHFCGCNGVTYPDLQTACAAGVAVIGESVCGQSVTVGAAGGSAGIKVTYCATNDQCSGPEVCCGITGRCYDPSQPVLCSFPPAGTSVPCIDDAQCVPGQYCFADGCDGPGGCRNIPGTGECTGQLDPVCGCDGKSYVNSDCAAVAGTRVAHAGQCP